MAKGGKTILLVEDDADNSEIIAELLMDAGYDVVAKENGIEALDHLRTSESKPDLIVLDLMMPGMDGWEFAEKGRATGLADDEIPLIVLSAISNVESKAKTIPAAAYLQKPVELTLLLETVKKVCGEP
jgi:two-component system, chemotaxis family, chemotaxis protein CheY